MQGQDGANELKNGWPVIAGATLGMSIGAASLMAPTFGIYFAAMAADIGWTMTTFSAMMLPFGLVACAASIIFGVLIDKLGVRPILVFGYLFFLVTMAGLALMPEIAWVLGFWIAMTGVSGMANGSMAYARIINAKFALRRGTALGIMATGVGIVGFGVPVGSALIIEEYGWRASYGVTGAVVALLAPIALIAVWKSAGKSPADAQREVRAQAGAPPIAADEKGHTFRQLLSTRAMWTIIFGIVFVSLGINGWLVHIPTMLEGKGFAPVEAALAVSFFSVAMILSRLATGIAIDRIFAPFVIAATSLGGALGMLTVVWVGSDIPALTYLGVAMLGIAYGADADVLAYIMSRYFGLASFGRAFGMLNGMGLIGAGMSSLVIAWASADGTDYDTGLYTMAGIVALGALGYMTAPRFKSSVLEPALDDAEVVEELHAEPKPAQ